MVRVLADAYATELVDLWENQKCCEALAQEASSIGREGWTDRISSADRAAKLSRAHDAVSRLRADYEDKRRHDLAEAQAARKQETRDRCRASARTWKRLISDLTAAERALNAGEFGQFAVIMQKLATWHSEVAEDVCPVKAESSGGRSKAAPPWTPPPGYVGTNTIKYAGRFRKHGKNPASSTIQRWVERSGSHSDSPVKKKVVDPVTHERYYPESWVKEQIQRWNPRQSGA